MARVGRIIVGRSTCGVYVSFALKDVVKGFPNPNWVPAKKLRRLPAWVGPKLCEALEAASCQVTIELDPNQPPSQSGPAGRAAGNWANAMLTAVGGSRADAAFRALTRVLHRDIGGTDQFVIDLLAARDRLRVQV
jgi:hypothetical protein